MMLPILFSRQSFTHCEHYARRPAPGTPQEAVLTQALAVCKFCKAPIDIGLVLILSALIIPLILSTKQILRNYLLASCFIEYLLTDLIS